MDEIEKRVNRIDSGQLSVLNSKFDYIDLLEDHFPHFERFPFLVYQYRLEELFAQIEKVLSKQEIVVNDAVPCYDKNWYQATEQEYFENRKLHGKPLTIDVENDDYILLNLDSFDNLTCYEDYKYQRAALSEVQQANIFLRNELLAYKAAIEDVFQKHSIIINCGNDGIEQSKAVEVQNTNYCANDAEYSNSKTSNTDEKRLPKIRNKLDCVSVNLSPEDLEQLVFAINEFYIRGIFPKLTKEIEVLNCKNIKRFGWALNRVFYYVDHRKIPIELLYFAKKYISIFKNVRFDPVNRKKCLVYKYLTENPDKKKNP